MISKLWIVILVILVLASPAPAQDPDAIKGAVGAPKTDTTGRLSGDASFGQINEDWYTTINLGFSLDLGTVGFGIQVPLRLRVVDNDPDNPGGLIRQEDWDEFSDYLKIIRYFRYGHKGEFLYLMVGDLPGAIIGHGTIVNRYYNNIDLDHYKMGLAVDLNTDYGGVETLLNNAFLSNLFAVRAYLRPWSFVDTESYLNNLAVGFSVASDVTAPYALVGNEVEDGYPKVANERAATILGGDIEFRVLDSSWLTMTPYLDLNHIASAGTGFHLGILNVFHLPVISMDLQARLEYRYFTGDYIPAYFNSYYEIQKFTYPYRDATLGQEVSAPKRQVLGKLGDEGLNGYYAEMVFDFLGLFSLGASYDDYDGPFNSNLRIYLDVPALEVFQFGCFYYKHSFEGASEAFTFDDKSLFLVEARYQISSFLYLLGQYWRIWQLNQTTGVYESVDDWSVGIGVSYNF